MIDNLNQPFIVDGEPMEELKSLDKAFRQLKYERIEEGNFFKDANSRLVRRARQEAAGALQLVRMLLMLKATK